MALTLPDELAHSLLVKLISCPCDGGEFVLKSGDTMSGPLTLPGGSVSAPSLRFVGPPGIQQAGIFPNINYGLSISSNGQTLLDASFGGGFKVNSHLSAPSGNIGSMAAGSLGVLTDFSCENVSTLARNNLGCVTIGNSALDPNDETLVIHKFLGNGDIGFHKVTPVPQQSAPGNTLEEVLVALRNYGLLS